jgi:hypothetical protein
MELWVGCLAGALQESEYIAKLSEAGFADISVETWRVYEGVTPDADGTFASAFVRATRPRS